MTRTRLGVGFLVATVAFLLGSCALLTKAEPLTPRYFSVEQGADVTPVERSVGLQLRLGPVRSASHLDERICYRKNSAELGFYSDRRWTEIPEEYMRRALERELFERRGVQRVVVGEAPTLDVEVTAFEELRSSPTQARLALRLSLRNEGLALLEDSLEIVQPVESDARTDAEQALAMAFAATVAEAAQTVAARVVLQLDALQSQAVSADGE